MYDRHDRTDLETIYTVTRSEMNSVSFSTDIRIYYEVHFKPSSPLKTAFRVLNYARKTKYPERRSALTYIDEEEPSRLDYGKHKFGGPFTEEEVEDVKTILRMLAFFVIISIGYVFSGDPQSLIHAHIIPSAVDTRSCVEGNLTGVILIPVYRFVLFPLLKTNCRVISRELEPDCF